MKKLISSIYIVLLSAIVAAQGLEKVIVEKYYISNANDAAASGGALRAGSVTYRIFADMLPGYRFQATYGIHSHELKLATTTSFFNDENYGGTVANVIPDQKLNDHVVMLDSWLSVGAASEGTLGILKIKDDETGTVVNAGGYLQNENPAAGIPLKKRDGLINGTAAKVTGFGIDSIVDVFKNKSTGSLFSTTNGSWASMLGSIGPDSIDNKVLIAQVTTDGVFSFELNIQIGTPYGGVENYVARNPVSNEIQLTSLIYPEKTLAEKNNPKGTWKTNLKDKNKK